MDCFDGRILLVAALPPPVGGDATWALKFLDYCKEKKICVDVVNSSISGKRAKSVSDNWNIKDEVKRCFYIWSEVRKAIKNNLPQIAHVNTSCSPKGIFRDWVTVQILLKAKVPYVLHCHCNVPDAIGNRKIPQKVLDIVIRKAKKTIVLNRKSYEYVNCHGNNCQIIPNFIDKEYIVTNRKVHEKIENVLFVGHVRKTKGIDEIINVSRKFPDINFSIVGPLTEDYTADDIAMNTIGNVHITGNMDSNGVKKKMDEADLLLFPSHTEGFSVTVLEAMSRGLPIIASDVGANYEMIENCGGIIVPSQNESAIIDAINEMKDKSTRQKMSDWNIKKACEYYSRDEVMKVIIGLYSE